jgi:hypothetical protein
MKSSPTVATAKGKKLLQINGLCVVNDFSLQPRRNYLPPCVEKFTPPPALKLIEAFDFH